MVRYLFNNLNRWGWARAENYDKARTAQFKRSVSLAIRTDKLPFTFEDEHEKTYRQIVWRMSREMKRKYSVRKDGVRWEINKI